MSCLYYYIQAKEKNRTKPGVAPQTAETKNPREGGNSDIYAFKIDFVREIALIFIILPTGKSLFQLNNPNVGESQSKTRLVYIFVAEMIPVLISVYNHSSIVAIR